jgi:hypothetical protein
MRKKIEVLMRIRRLGKEIEFLNYYFNIKISANDIHTRSLGYLFFDKLIEYLTDHDEFVGRTNWEHKAVEFLRLEMDEN